MNLAGVGRAGHVPARGRCLKRCADGPRTGIVVDEVGNSVNRCRGHRTVVNAAAAKGVVREHRDCAGEVVRTQAECAAARLGAEPTKCRLRSVGDSRDAVGVVSDRRVVGAGLPGIDAVAVERPVGGVENVSAPVMGGVAAVGTVARSRGVRSDGNADCHSKRGCTDEQYK